MRSSRIFTDQQLVPGAGVALDDRAGRYVSQVLRLRRGQTIVLFNGDGADYEATLTRCDRRSYVATVGRELAREQPPALHIHLGIGISRGERMDFAIQKSVELGVGMISPLFTERSVVQLKADRLDRRHAHWQGIVTSACEQSGRSLLPSLQQATTLDPWLSANRGGVMLHHEAGTTLPELPQPQDALNLLIGPEGGLSPSERAAAADSGYTGVRLGPRVLRTESAPLAALAAIQTLWGDFR